MEADSGYYMTTAHLFTGAQVEKIKQRKTQANFEPRFEPQNLFEPRFEPPKIGVKSKRHNAKQNEKTLKLLRFKAFSW